MFTSCSAALKSDGVSTAPSLRKVRLTLLLVLAVGQVVAQGLPKVKGSDVWITKDILWEKAPKEINPNLSTGLATVLYFRSDGRFGLMHCRLNKGPNYLVVSNGDGQGISEGSWAAQATGIVVRYRLVFRTVLRRVPPEKLPGAEESTLIEITAKGELKMGDAIFVPAGDRLHSNELYPEFFTFRQTLQ